MANDSKKAANNNNVETPPTPSTSFVYPVRTLLSNIQPDPESAALLSPLATPSNNASLKRVKPNASVLSPFIKTSASPFSPSSSTPRVKDTSRSSPKEDPLLSLPLPNNPEPESSPFFVDSQARRRRSMADGPDVDEDSSALLSGADNVQGGESSSRLEGGKTRAKSSPMFFKDFPKPTSFTFRSSDKTPSASSSTHIFPPFVSNRTPSANRIRDQRTVTTPDGQVLAFSPQPERNEEEMRAIRTPSISDAGADAFLQVFGGSTYSPPPIPDDFSPPLNLAATGIVRLGSASSSSGSASAYRGSNRASGSERSSGRQGDESGAASDDPNSGPRSASFSETSSVDVQLREPDQNLYTVRHERIVTDDGHHLVLGHDGKFVKCEDEPIRTPGAVQGYGVLIALEEDDATGSLLPRQVSENCTEILGLSPKYLFSLGCFTETLPDAQIDILWDNIQTLTDGESSTDGGLVDDSPTVFLLSGYSESQEGEMQSERRLWTCWCAAHRPKARPHPPVSGYTSGGTSSSKSSQRRRSTIILEFELERDMIHPLYPPFSGNQSSSGSSRGTNSSTSGSNRTETGNTQPSTSTIVDEVINIPSPDPEGAITPELKSPGPDTPGSSQITPDATVRAPSSEGAPSRGSGSRSPESLVSDESYYPSPEDVFESTTNRARPLRALERMRKITRAVALQPPIEESNSPANKTPAKRPGVRRRTSHNGVGTMDIFAVLAQVNDQVGNATDLDSFLNVVVGIIKDLTQFHRVLVYQFDEKWNGQVVAELLDWSQSHDLYKGLHFPASDIPAQARELYKINKVRLLYDRAQLTARLVAKSEADLETPLDMTHCYLRAMSPIHIKYLENMGVRASMSVSIMAFGALWGLITCHSYGDRGMRVSFRVRQMLRLLGDTVSRNIERLSYARRLHTRKLISTLPTENHPTGYIVSNADDLLSLFDADFGVLVIGDGAKIMGPNEHGQEILIITEYLRLKQFSLIQVSQELVNDFPDLDLPSGLEVIAGLLYVPLSPGGKDFIALLRKGQRREVQWAGKPSKDVKEDGVLLEPRRSFKLWSEMLIGRCRAWTDEQLDTAGVLALVYGKFIEVWREKERALNSTQLTHLLLSNASHEVRTPLNHIINYLELAMASPLDGETLDNLRKSHSASKSLLFTINDLLDLTKLESGNATSFNEPFNLPAAIDEAVRLYRSEATRRSLTFNVNTSDSPKVVIGDAKKIQTVVANLTANAVKFTSTGTITVECNTFNEPLGLRDSKQVAVEIAVADTGCGIDSSKLERIFREFEQVESTVPKTTDGPGLGLGLAVVARIVEQSGGQLRVDSKPDEGSRFSILIPLALHEGGGGGGGDSERSFSPPSSSRRSRTSSGDGSRESEIDSLVEALKSDHMADAARTTSPSVSDSDKGAKLKMVAGQPQKSAPAPGTFEVASSKYPIRSVRVNAFDLDKPKSSTGAAGSYLEAPETGRSRSAAGALVSASTNPSVERSPTKLRVLVVEDDAINRTILAKRLTLDGHIVVNTTNGQEAVSAFEADKDFDCVLMDIQMPILNGFEATERIRALELESPSTSKHPRPSLTLNGRLPIFAVSASLLERQHEEMHNLGMDGWILKPIEFKRLRVILKGITDLSQRQRDMYQPSCSWEAGGWLAGPRSPESEPAAPDTTS